MHHGSIDKKIRLWVENSLRENKLKVVVCTSSLDLELTLVQLKCVSKLEAQKVLEGLFKGLVGVDTNLIIPAHIFSSTHAIELIESVALQEGIKKQMIEDRLPHINSYDVLIQFLTSCNWRRFFPKKFFH